MDVHMHNNVPNDADAISRIEEFSCIAVFPKSSYYHNLGFPTFALTTESNQGKAKKWEGRLVLVIFMGPSLHHAVSI